ncbi:hypothetical protein QZM76_14050 [Burkholderia multivorans]|nr:hypothetical protein [Burkholderia multivorans]
MNDQQQSRADALTDDRRQALGEAISEYFEKLDSDEGIRTSEGRILRAFDYCDSRNVDDLIDRAILPALATSANETGAEGATWRAGVEAVAKMIEKKAADYLDEYGYVERDTGAVSWGSGNHADAKRDYHSSLVELAEEVRAMVPAMASAAPADPLALSAEQVRLQDYAEQNMLTLEEAADELRAGEHSDRVPPIDTISPTDERAAKISDYLNAPGMWAQVYCCAVFVRGCPSDVARSAADAAVKEFGDAACKTVADLTHTLDEVLRVN